MRSTFKNDNGSSSASMIILSLVAVLVVAIGCDAPAEPQAKKDNRGIIGKKTQDVGEFDPNGGAKVDDGKVNQQQLATPGIGALAGYGPAAQQASKLAVQQALNLFNAANGRYPKDHTEFMEKIIKANNIRLPVLPGGRQYQYDVANHELVVVAASAGTE